MRYVLFLLFCFVPFWLGAQAVDSVALRQVDSLIRVSGALTGKREFDKAFEANAVAEKIALEKLGRESAAYGSCCSNRGRINYAIRNYPEAEKWYSESIAIREKVLGKEHLDYAASLRNLAVLFDETGKSNKAETLFLECKSIREKALGREHPLYASTLNSLAIVYKNKGQYEKAEPLYLEAKAIREKALGKEHPDYAISLNNLAVLYWEMGQYEKAEPLYLEAKAIREKVLGKEHPDYAISLNNLAILYKNMNRFDKAEPLYIESKTVMGKAYGKEHPSYAMSLDGLAILYDETGQYKKAEPIYLEAKAIREKTLGREHPEYANSLFNLAAMYRDIGKYEQSEPLYLEAKAIREKTLGREHPNYAASLNALAVVYHDMGQYEKSEPLYLEAKAIREKTLGREHPSYAASLNNLAGMYLDMGKYEKARPLYHESKAIREKILGKEHSDYAASLQGLAGLYQGMGQYEKVEPLFLELSTVNRHLIEQAVHHLSESELNNYIDKFSNSQNQILSFTQVVGSKKTTPVCYDNILFYKGFLLQSTGWIKQLALSDEGAADKYSRLKGLQRRLTAQYTETITKRDSALVAQLEEEANNLEKELARTVAGFGQAMRQVKWQEVQAALKPGEAAVELVSYRFYQKKQTDSTMYAALVLLPSADAPQFIPLFEEKRLTALLQPEGKVQDTTFYNDLYAADKKGRQLYDLIWKPIAAALPEKTAVYCSPSGLLHRINLGAIPTPDGKTLAVKYQLTTLGSTRQLVVEHVSTPNQNATAQLYGSIQYDSMPAVAANLGAKTDDMTARRGLDFTQADSTLRGATWNTLHWTAIEIAAAAKTMKNKGFTVDIKKGAKATEESFKAIGTTAPSPRILHVATHGFFFPDPKGEKVGGREGEKVGGREGEKVGGREGEKVGGREGEKVAAEKTFKVSENPMIRSGLILAGGNHAWKTGKPLRPDLEDGILTAYEISQINLSSTELVVLSACETGLGDLVGNEGVYGLQRAFKIAGAHYLIMSLWQVPDRPTQVFMTTFYKRWLEDKMAIPEAFRATQAELKAKYGDAFKWAGFVLVE